MVVKSLLEIARSQSLRDATTDFYIGINTLFSKPTSQKKEDKAHGILYLHIATLCVFLFRR